MEKTIDVACPNCGLKDKQIVREGKLFILCDCEQGGCDEHFAIDVKFRVEYKVYILSDATISSYDQFLANEAQE